MSLGAASSSWRLAAFATSLPGEFGTVLGQIAALGFTHVDLVAEIDRPAEQLEELAASGLIVSCAALGRRLPPDHCLDTADIGVRRATLDLLKRQIADAAQLGATMAYLVPPPISPPVPGGELYSSPPGTGGDIGGGTTALAYFAEGCALLADFAEARMVRLCVEHVPGRALPSAAAALDWLQQVAHPRLGLLLDVGHCLISNEDAAAVVQRAGPHLSYVHLDDNDGIGDLHWPLFAGRLTPKKLAEVMAALHSIEYRGALALELNPANADPLEALHDGKRIVEQLIRDD